MIKEIHIQNFKSLVDFKTTFEPMTVFVGNNSVGKSTVLQAIQFICGSIKDDYTVLLGRRGWKVENIKSKFTNSRFLRFELTFEIKDNYGEVNKYIWNTEMVAYTSKNEIYLNRESIDVNDEVILEYEKGKDAYVAMEDNKSNGELHIGNGLSFSSSLLKLLNNTKHLDKRLVQFINHALNLMSFELLTPANMRLSSRGVSDTIGPTGNNLPSFIKKMDIEQKTAFMNKIQWLLDDTITEIDTQTKGQPGWTQIVVKEKYGNSGIQISSKDMSDGMLRLLAFVAISEIRTESAVFLLDEVENGINVHYIEKVIRLFNDICEKNGSQVIFTTHSTLFMDYVSPDSIVFLDRNENGETFAKKIFDDEKLRKRLEYLYPGEVLLNMEGNE